MIWNKEKKQFNWLFVSLAVFCTVFLVLFDLSWRLVEMNIVQFLGISGVIWLAGVIIIYMMGKKSDQS